MNDEKNYKIIVAHPEKQHSLQLAVGLKEKKMLCKYITSVYDKPRSITNRIKRFLPEKYRKKANTRSIKELEDQDIIQIGEINNLLITFLYNIFHLKKICVFLRLKNADYFGIKAAKYAIKYDVDAVVCYDTRAKKMFSHLKKEAPNILRILDTTIITAPYMRYLYDEQIEKRNAIGLKNESPKLWDDIFLHKISEEIKMTDYFLVASNIVAQSLKFCGVQEERILKIPYGVDVIKYRPRVKKNIDGPLKLIFVGGGYRKGLDMLLEVVSQYNKNDVRLEILGNFVSIKELIEPYTNCKNIVYGGFLTSEELIKKYQEADVFILPSVGEGMALVGLEAMACGLPIICSENTGVNELITNYEEGIIIPVGKIDAIKDAIEYCISNRKQIITMGENARKIAEKHTWKIYQKNVSARIEEILNDRKI